MRSVIVLASLTCTTALGADPVPKDGNKHVFYFPTKEGDKRVLKLTVGGRTVEVIETVTKVEARDGNFRVTVLRSRSKEPPSKNPSKGPPTVFEVSATGIARVTAGSKELADPVPVLKLPAKAGDKWTTKADVPGAPDTVHTVGKEEEIEVPAGKFKAISVESTRNGASGTYTSWYAPNVGLIKMVSKFGDTEQTTVLKSFTPGK